MQKLSAPAMVVKHSDIFCLTLSMCTEHSAMLFVNGTAEVCNEAQEGVGVLVGSGAASYGVRLCAAPRLCAGLGPEGSGFSSWRTMPW